MIFWNNALSIFFKTSNGRLSCPNIFFQRKIGFESYVAAYVRYLCEWIIAFCWKLYHACHNTVGNFLNILIKSKWIKINIPWTQSLKVNFILNLPYPNRLFQVRKQNKIFTPTTTKENILFMRLRVPSNTVIWPDWTLKEYPLVFQPKQREFLKSSERLPK